ncbi:MAG: ABC transporter permease [Xanthomonadales bacterium]|nr:ABC transporter permease [Xanthomonadales bacterium]
MRQALRYLIRRAGYSLSAILTLALGIGLVSTQYSLIDGLLLRPLPFAAGEEIFHVAHRGSEGGWRTLPLAEFVAQQEATQGELEMAAFQSMSQNMVGTDGLPQRVWGSAVSAGFFDLLRVAPILGRGFDPAEGQSGAAPVVLLGETLWRDAFAAEPGLLGQAIEINGVRHTVIGILPTGVRFPFQDQLWTNLMLPPPGTTPVEGSANEVQALARLPAGLAPTAAAQALTLATERFRRQHGDAEPVAPMLVRPVPLAYNGNAQTVVLMGSMLAMTLLVLVLACANVANLLFVQAIDRLRELAVRAALGAGRWRIIGQLLLEGGLLTLAGSLLGLLLAYGGIALLQHETAARIDMAGWIQFDLNGRVLAVSIAAGMLAGLVASLLPALRIARSDLAQRLRSDGRGQVGAHGLRWKRWMISGQFALAAAALLMALLLSLSVQRSGQSTLQFDPDALLIGRLELQGPQYAEAAARSRFYEQLLARLQSLPGVAAASVSSRDLIAQGVYTGVELAGSPVSRRQDQPQAFLEVVSRDYFRVVDRQALRGRVFNHTDAVDSPPVALINEAFATQHYGESDPIGQQLRSDREDGQWATIIGVVPDLHMQGLGNAGSGAGWYLLQEQIGWGWLDLLLRVEGPAETLIEPARRVVAELDPGLPVHSVQTLRGRTDRAMAALAITSAMAGSFALAAVLLASIGAYALLAYGVRSRTRELGLRLALGAGASRVIGDLLRQDLARVGLGIFAGLLIGALLVQPLTPILPHVSSDEPGLYLLVGAVLVCAGLLAAWLPARRAARIDPQLALRSD